MRVFLANLPQRTHDNPVVVRVIRDTPTTFTVRLSAMPGGPPVKTTTCTIAKSDLDTMLKTKLARRITSVRCPACGATARLAEAQNGRRKRLTIVWACSGCEWCSEV